MSAPRIARTVAPKTFRRSCLTSQPDRDINIENIAELTGKPVHKALEHELVSQELEKDPEINVQQVFNKIYDKMQEKHGQDMMRFPKEIIWLMGAPGSGKGTNTPFIMQSRGITASPIIMSELLTGPAAEELKRQGKMINDATALEVLMEQLLNNDYKNGVIVDGFPRTKTQVRFVHLLHAKMIELRKKYFHDPLHVYFRRPSFRMCVLYVDEEESIKRQLARGQKVIENNKVARETGIGELMEERVTDYNIEAARQRYKVFKDHWDTLLAMRKHFSFSMIDAMKPINRVQEAIMQEFSYQSSLDLDEDTYDLLASIPVATKVALNARQNMVSRLDRAASRQKHVFESAKEFITNEFMPAITLNAISGMAIVYSRSPLLSDRFFLQLVMDIMSERGYFITCSRRIEREVLGVRDDAMPMDPESAVVVRPVEAQPVTTFRFVLRFKRTSIRLD